MSGGYQGGPPKQTAEEHEYAIGRAINAAIDDGYSVVVHSDEGENQDHVEVTWFRTGEPRVE